jgi:hypothetical protein
MTAASDEVRVRALITVPAATDRRWPHRRGGAMGLPVAQPVSR